MSSHPLKARLLLAEVESPVPGRPSTPPHHQYNPRTLSPRLYSHEAHAGTPSRASLTTPVDRLEECVEAGTRLRSLKAR